MGTTDHVVHMDCAFEQRCYTNKCTPIETFINCYCKEKYSLALTSYELMIDYIQSSDLYSLTEFLKRVETFMF